MTFNKEKNGYSIVEVDEYLRTMASNEADRSARIEELKAEINKLNKQLDAEKQKRDLINKAIYNAVAKADQIEKLSRQKYEQDMAHLKAFHEKWTSYYNRILEKYPINDELIQMAAFNRRMNDILNGKEAQPIESYLQAEAERVKKATGNNQNYFDSQENAGSNAPMSKIKAYFNSQEKDCGAYNFGETDSANKQQSVGAFSLEEAQNPTDDLSTIMRDLGFDIED